jgi:hemerythrin-like domain-containing protein
MLMIHSVFRSQFADTLRLLRAAPDGIRERAQILGDLVLELAAALHRHHEGEDDLLWDRLEQKAPSCAAHVATMRAQHAEVSDLLTTVESVTPIWMASATATDRDAVVAAVQAVFDALLEHLGDEESDILPIAAVTLTPQEWGELGQRGRSEIPRDRMLIQLGTILESAAPEHRERFWKELPPPVRLLYRLVGKRQYERERARIEGTAA